jgi:hypothetical protein
LSAADLECFIEVMTGREQPDRRFVLIIDDAELLRSDAIDCLRLLAGFAKPVRAQVIFIGRPRFWQVLGHAENPDSNGLIRRHWELAEPPGWGNKATADQCQPATEPLDDRVSPEVAVPADVGARPDRPEETSQPVASPRRRRGSVGLAAAAVVMFVMGPLTLRQPPLPSAGEQPHEAGTRGDWARRDQPSFQQASATMSSNAKVGVTDPQFSISTDRPEVAHADTPADAGRESIQLGDGTAPPPRATSAPVDDPVILSEVAAAPVQPPSATPSDRMNSTEFAAATAPAGDAAGAAPQSAALASAADGTGEVRAEQPLPQVADYAVAFDITDAALQPSAAVSAEGAMPQPPAEAARAGAVLAQAAQVPEPAPAAEQPPVSGATESTVPQPPPADTAPAVAQESRTPQPAPAAEQAPVGAAIESTVPPPPPTEGAPAVAQESKTPQTPAAAEQPSVSAATAAPVPQAPAEAAPAVAPASGTPTPPSAAEQPPVKAPIGVMTDTAQAGAASGSERNAQIASPTVSLDLTLLLSRGDAMLELGDISAARRLYERAAALGSARAATAAGKTYDAAFLASIHARGIVPDAAAAAAWYRKAVALGDREAAGRLARLTPLN